MSARQSTLALTAVAPMIWGSSYYVISQFLPDGHPLGMSALRALSGGVLLLLIVRQLPPVNWLGRIFLLGALNFTIFWGLLFFASSRLPGGIAATLMAMQSLFIILIANRVLGTPIRGLAVVAAITGIIGVGILLYNPLVSLDLAGCIAAIAGGVSMAFGSVLSRKWQAPGPVLSVTAWQLTAGGLLLVPFAWWFEPALPSFTIENGFAIFWLGIIGAAATYILWFRGIAKLEPSVIGTLGFLSPVTAVIIGAVALGEIPDPVQWLGMAIILGSIWMGQMPASAPAGKTVKQT